MDGVTLARLEAALEKARLAANEVIAIYQPHFLLGQRTDTLAEYTDQHYQMAASLDENVRSDSDNWNGDRIRWATISQISRVFVDVETGLCRPQDVDDTLYRNVRDAIDVTIEEMNE